MKGTIRDLSNSITIVKMKQVHLILLNLIVISKIMAVKTRFVLIEIEKEQVKSLLKFYVI